MVNEKEIVLDVNEGKIIPFVRNVIIKINTGNTNVNSIKLGEPIRVKRVKLYKYSTNDDICIDLIV